MMTTTRSGVAAERSTALDAARGVAALSVLVYHSWLYTRDQVSDTARASWTDYALHELRLGLVLFFVLSGFLLWRPWVAAGLGRRERRAGELHDYLVRRAARVLPAYYLALAGAIALVWPAGGTFGARLPSPGQLPLFLVFGENYAAGARMSLDPPMWTLVIEVSFYLLLPLAGALALRCAPRRWAQALVPLGLLAIGVWFNHAVAGRGGAIVSKVLPAMLPYFAVGMLAALLLDGRVPARRAAAVLLGAGAALVLGDGVWQAHGAWSGSHSYAYRIWRDLPAAVGFAAIVAVAASGSLARAARRRRRPLVALGTISYGVYLWHVPVLVAARHLGVLPLSTPLAALLALTVAGALATASWRWVERPSIAWARRRVARARERRARAPDRVRERVVEGTV
jgi:peptidoglycan/LPS O-acetylase OafA/YrhL